MNAKRKHLIQSPSTISVASAVLLPLKEAMRKIVESDDPDFSLSRKVDDLATNGHYMGRPLTEKDISNLAILPCIDFYRTCFSNGADFRFVFVGAFTEQDLKPLIETYIAMLSRGETIYPRKAKP